MNGMIHEVQEMAILASEQGLQLKGRIQILVNGKLLFEEENAIMDDLKGAMRDTMNSNTDFALDNLQATQIANASLGAGANGKDGIVIGEGVPAYQDTWLPGGSAAPNFMASVVHPTDPSGSYYRQWQGAFQNLLAGTIDIDAAIIGQNYLNTDNHVFVLQYATGSFASVALAQNDIITINWKVTVG